MTRYTNRIYVPRMRPFYQRITMEQQMAIAALVVIVMCVVVGGMS